jgi:hypothetical protein
MNKSSHPIVTFSDVADREVPQLPPLPSDPSALNTSGTSDEIAGHRRGSSPSLGLARKSSDSRKGGRLLKTHKSQGHIMLENDVDRAAQLIEVDCDWLVCFVSLLVCFVSLLVCFVSLLVYFVSLLDCFVYVCLLFFACLLILSLAVDFICSDLSFPFPVFILHLTTRNSHTFCPALRRCGPKPPRPLNKKSCTLSRSSWPSNA